MRPAARAGASVSEAAWTDTIIAMAQLAGWRVYHALPAWTNKGYRTMTQGDAGWPDLVLAHPDRGFIIAELKVKGRAVTTEQHAWLDTLQQALFAHSYGWEPIQPRVELWRVPDDMDAIKVALGIEEALR